MRVPRATNRGLAWSALIIMVCGLVASCASGTSQSAQQAKDSVSPVSTTSSSIAPAPSASALASTAASAQPAGPPQFSQLKTAVAYRSGATPVSQNINGGVDVESYLQMVMRNNKAVWEEVFRTTGGGLSAPTLTFDVTSRSDRYVSACTRGGEKIVVTPEYGNLFYCSADHKPYGAIALPTGVVTQVWKKTTRPLADLSVAISTSRQAALLVLGSLQQQLNLPAPSPLGRQYTAACMSGVWAHAVYAQNAFPDNDLATALSTSFSIPSEVDGMVTSPKADDTMAATSWLVGFHNGDPGECGLSFWK